MVVDVVVVDDAVRPIPMAACGRGRTKAALRRGRWCISNTIIVVVDDRVAAAKAATVVAAMRISISAAGAWGVLLGLPWNLWLWLWRYHQLCGRYYESSAGRIARPYLHLRGRRRVAAASGAASEIEGSCVSTGTLYFYCRLLPAKLTTSRFLCMSGLGSVIKTDRRMG